jgi:hypothetical protein
MRFSLTERKKGMPPVWRHPPIRQLARSVYGTAKTLTSVTLLKPFTLFE